MANKALHTEVAALPGERVYIPDLECEATILSVSITTRGHRFEVAWFNLGKRENEWLDESEFKTIDQS